MSSHHEWLQHLTPGSPVIQSTGYYGDSVATVDRVTATQIIVNNSRYRKADGYRVGGDTWSRSSLKEATPERLATVRKSMLVEIFSRNKSWGDLSLEQLEAVMQIVKQAKVTP